MTSSAVGFLTFTIGLALYAVTGALVYVYLTRGER